MTDALAALDRTDAPDISDDAARELAQTAPLARLIELAGELRDRGHGNLVSYSRKVFIPLTHLCRDSCHYCTFAQPPARGEQAYLSPEQVLDIARAGARAGCKEALFTLGDKPEQRYGAARSALRAAGPRDHDLLPARGRRPGAEADRPAAAHQRRRHGARRYHAACVRCRFRKASCWRLHRIGCPSAASRISDRPTRSRRAASKPSAPPARRRSRSPPAC